MASRGKSQRLSGAYRVNSVRLNVEGAGFHDITSNLAKLCQQNGSAELSVIAECLLQNSKTKNLVLTTVRLIVRVQLH